MKKWMPALTVALGILFSVLFYRQALGLNFVIFESIALLVMFFVYRPIIKNPMLLFVVLATLASLAAWFFTHTAWAFTVHLFFLIMLPVMLSSPNFRSLIYLYVESVVHLVSAQVGYFQALGACGNKKPATRSFFRVLTWIGVPLLVVIVFVFLYRIANPVFDNHVTAAADAVARWLSYISWGWFWTFLFGVFVCNVLFVKFGEAALYSIDKASSDTLTRKMQRKPRRFRMNALVTEYRSGLFLLIALNALILYLNIIDVVWVWFGFEWNGDYLKQFVHSGTWILVFSILISMVIVIFYFRGNLNFYRKNIWLKRLAVLWILQNAVMAVSVVIRNLWYIHYFALAYKRIAVLFFLLLVFVGLITVIVKIYKTKSVFWLIRVNSLALFSVLLFSSFFQWDRMIARYNFSHYNQSFVHFNFMARLSNNALPELDKDMAELNHIFEVQQLNMPFDVTDEKYMDIYRYHERIGEKKIEFIEKYESRGILSWNPADYRTYKALKGK